MVVDRHGAGAVVRFIGRTGIGWGRGPSRHMFVLGAGNRYGSALCHPPPVSFSARAGVGFAGAAPPTYPKTFLANFVQNF